MTQTETVFEHRQSAHCESGAIAGLLRHGGLDISEPMAFGLASGMTFAYLPFVKFSGQPLFAYRMPPGRIIRGLTRQLGVRMYSATYRSAEAGMAALDHELAAGRPVGVQASVYWLSYFPPDMRFHFNAHNLIVYGRRDESYLISDPVIDVCVECSRVDLEKARFTRGIMAPRGRLYYPRKIPEKPDFVPAIRRAIRFTTRMMLYTPAPLFGVRGIRRVARRIGRMEKTLTRPNRLLLGHIVRMQEEIGTGGGGFRFLYAAFLQEAAQITQSDELDRIAGELAKTGDQWREFALQAAKMCKQRLAFDPTALEDRLNHIAGREDLIYRALKKAIKQI